MSEFIGSRISLVSKSDIRYVGTLHDINSEKSTVALENVVSFGTEGRRSNPEDEVPPSDTVYDYIVFRGSDVKDLRIEEPPKENKPPPVPNDPAILGSGSRPSPAPQHPIQPQQDRQAQPLPFQQQPPFPYYYPPLPGQRFGPGGPQAGFPPGPGFPGMPYGGPPGWYPPPGQGFPQAPGPFSPGQGPVGPSNQRPLQDNLPQPPGQGSQPSLEQSNQTQSHAVGASGHSNDLKPQPDQVTKPSNAEVASGAPGTGPPPPLESKPDVSAALAPPGVAGKQPITTSKPSSDGLKNGRIVPAVPLPGAIKGTSTGGAASVSPYNVLPQPNASHPGPDASLAQGHPSSGMKQVASDIPVPVTTYNVLPQPLAKAGHSTSNASLEYQNATKAATAAVAAAMAKLPPAPGQKQHLQGDGAVDNLTRRVQEMRTADAARNQRQANFGSGHRGGARGGGRHHSTYGHKIEVPTTDYDFASANAKFNKQDLVKEAIAGGSPVGTPSESPHANGLGESIVEHVAPSAESTSTHPASYNRSSSFFDNISSESKDREEATSRRLGGREWRGEEMKKNMETFGQGSVDSGYRGGYRGRGRGRGTGRGRGGFQGYRGSRGGPRDGRGNTAATNTTAPTES